MDGTRGRGQWQTPDIRTRYTSSSSGSRWPLRGVVPAGARRLRRPVRRRRRWGRGRSSRAEEAAAVKILDVPPAHLAIWHLLRRLPCRLRTLRHAQPGSDSSTGRASK